MRKMSTFQIVLISTFAALAAAGVLIFALFTATSANNSIGPVTLWGTFDQATVQQVLATAGATHTELQSVTYVQKDPSTYVEDLTEALASGQAPDIFLLTQDQAYAQKSHTNLIAPSALSPSQFQNSFIDGASPFQDPTGTIALPLLADPLVMYWNKDLLAAAHVSQPPQYWDELYDFAKNLTQKSDTGTIQLAAVAFGNFDNVDHAKDIVSMLIEQAGGHVTVRDSNGKLISGLLSDSADQSGLSAAPSAVRFFTEFADPSKEDYSWNRSFPEAQRAFVDGQLALYIGYASEENAIKAANPNLNFAVALVPQIRNARTSVVTGRVYGVAVTRNAKNALGGFTVAELLAAGDVSSALSVALDLPSARRDLEQSAMAQANTKLAPSEANIIANAAIIMRTWTDPDPEKTDQIFRAMIEDTTSGAQLLNQAVSRADQQLNNLIGI